MPVLYRKVGITNEDFSVSYKMNIIIPIPTGTIPVSSYRQSSFQSLSEFGEYIDQYINPEGSTCDITDACTCIVSSGPTPTDILLHGLSSSALQVSDTLSPRILWFGEVGSERTSNIKITSTNGQLSFQYRVGTEVKGTIENNASGGRESLQFIPWFNGIDVILLNARHFYFDTDYNVWKINVAFRTNLLYSAGSPSWWSDWISGAFDPADPDNPYDGGGTSVPSDGEPGNFSEDSDNVEEDTLPSISAVGTGMATIFSPTTAQLKNLSDIFWGASWWQALQNTVEGIDKMFVSLGIVPFQVTSGATVEVTWLGLSITEVLLTLAAQQYYEFDMGSINLANDDRIFTSNSALDYSPFSKLGIYLPFIGYQELDIDEFRGATVNLKYRIDILSGTCVALVKINGNTIYQFTGNCMTQIPITSQSFETMITNAVNVGIAVSGVRSASAVGSAATEVNSELNNAGKTSEAQKTLADTKSRAHVEGATDRLLSACANSLMGLKPNYDKSGAVSNSASLLAVKQPFLFLTTPRQCIPAHYQRYSGFPSNITRKIGECSGFLVVESIRLNGLVATSKEVEEIYDLLKSGVIV